MNMKRKDSRLSIHIFDLDQDSVKLISFLELKQKTENNMSCKLCASKKRVGYITVQQKTYKLATVLTFQCNRGHNFSVAPERIDDSKIDTSENFKINFCFVLAMQILGKGLRSMSTFLGLLGIRVSEGNYRIWKKIQNKVGETEQLIAQQCCSENLRKEVEVTKKPVQFRTKMEGYP